MVGMKTWGIVYTFKHSFTIEWKQWYPMLNNQICKLLLIIQKTFHCVFTHRYVFVRSILTYRCIFCTNMTDFTLKFIVVCYNKHCNKGDRVCSVSIHKTQVFATDICFSHHAIVPYRWIMLSILGFLLPCNDIYYSRHRII